MKGTVPLLVGTAGAALIAAFMMSNRSAHADEGQHQDKDRQDPPKALPPVQMVVPTPLPTAPQEIAVRAKLEEDPAPLLVMARSLEAQGHPKAARAVLKKALTPVKPQRGKRIYALVASILKKNHPKASDADIKKEALQIVDAIKLRRKHAHHVVIKAKAAKKLKKHIEEIRKHQAASPAAPASSPAPVRTVRSPGPSVSAPVRPRAKPASTKTAGDASNLPRIWKSPLDQVVDSEWTRWVDAMKTADPSFKSKPGELGAFLFAPKRLMDLGLVTDVQRVSREDGGSAWKATWKAPLTEDIFLSSPPMQVAALGHSVQKVMPALDRHWEQLSPHLQLEDGTKITLSGVLALIHRAGLKGALGWLTKPEERIKFPKTQDAVLRANGIF